MREINRISTKAFNDMTIARQQEVYKTLCLKGAGYNPTYDRLKNFADAARVANTDAATALDGMLMKHYIAYREELEKMANDDSYVPDPKWVHEKIGDIIGYFHLLEGIIEARRAAIKDMQCDKIQVDYGPTNPTPTPERPLYKAEIERADTPTNPSDLLHEPTCICDSCVSPSRAARGDR